MFLKYSLGIQGRAEDVVSGNRVRFRARKAPTLVRVARYSLYDLLWASVFFSLQWAWVDTECLTSHIQAL